MIFIEISTRLWIHYDSFYRLDDSDREKAIMAMEYFPGNVDKLKPDFNWNFNWIASFVLDWKSAFLYTMVLGFYNPFMAGKTTWVTEPLHFEHW